MRTTACQMSLILLAASAAPGALAGPDILKCVDSAGHVTLTDQPCPAGSRVTLVIPDAAPERLPAARGAAQVGSSGSAGATGLGGDEPQVTAPATTVPAPGVERMPPPPRSKYKTPAGKRVPLSRDEATLRAAHMRMLINDDEMGRQAAQ
ncbi:hypothetical protein GCM10027321_41010 [Massilia terrae]|uniref:DUF4124 domain-containing protein n=1 Tax=Massilia terrae TaxID=1811224 RepID=A0ABT2CTY0_9BURK|nr:DUF4124 domain-containing protein [Massilia terrae]MCS0656645.1 DUF4124 domain-containing protein [Massilia terrae]